MRSNVPRSPLHSKKWASLPSERRGEGGAKRRSAQAKRGRLGCLLSRARGGASQEGLVSLLGAERMEMLL